jgi:hypothetical protein
MNKFYYKSLMPEYTASEEENTFMLDKLKVHMYTQTHTHRRARR